MSCGSPMPRGERIAKPAEWGTPIRPVFHSLRGEPNPEASMRTRFALVALAVALSTACGEGPLVPTSGAIRIVLTTIGADPDADGYAVTLAGAATNCPVAADNPRTVSVTTGAVKRDTARTTFQVICVATTAVIEVAAVTSGIDLDPDGYTVQVDGGASRALAVSGTIRFEGLGAGSHTVTMTGAAANCPIAPDNPRTVNVTTGAVTRDTARTKFQVTCGAATGSIQVTTATAGMDLDPDGYTVLLDNGQQRPLGDNGTTVIEGVSAGDHSVILFGAVGNC